MTLTVILDLAAPSAGTTVTLSLVPANAGTVPGSVQVLAGQRSATFNYVDGGTVSAATVTATLGASTASSTITLTPQGGCTGTNLLISEIRSRGAGGASDEFLELYNPTGSPVTLDSTWMLEARSNTSTTYSPRWSGSGTTLPPHRHFLIASAGYTQQPVADDTLSTGLTDATSLRLVHAGAIVDAICYAFDDASRLAFTTDATFTCEGTPVMNSHNNATTTNTDSSIERKPGGAAGNCVDTGDNATDFAAVMPAGPQSAASPPTP